MANKNVNVWIRYNGNEVPVIQGPSAPTFPILPGQWYEVPAEFGKDLSKEKGWDVQEKKPESKPKTDSVKPS